MQLFVVAPRFAPLLAALTLAACAPAIPFVEGPPEVDLAGPQAVFAAPPATLFRAIEETCAGPGQVLLRPSETTLLCEGLPPVEAAAALILQFGGTVEDLPRFVTAVESVAVAEGFLVTTDTYIRIPQQAGGERILRPDDPRMDRQIRRVLRRAGGTPL